MIRLQAPVVEQNDAIHNRGRPNCRDVPVSAGAGAGDTSPVVGAHARNVLCGHINTGRRESLIDASADTPHERRTEYSTLPETHKHRRHDPLTLPSLLNTSLVLPWTALFGTQSAVLFASRAFARECNHNTVFRAFTFGWGGGEVRMKYCRNAERTRTKYALHNIALMMKCISFRYENRSTMSK